MSVVALHVLHFPPSARLKAFFRFALMRRALPAADGAIFAKAMGCGRGAVFSIRPDWSRFAFLAEWRDSASAQDFFTSAKWKALEGAADSSHHFLLNPVHSKGDWDGKPRFLGSSGQEFPADKLAVITRADLKPRSLKSFFAHARQATDALLEVDGLRYSLGMGEWPFVRQATFSVWDGAEMMKAYAYKNAAHIKAMRGKNSEKWYGEEMYARFDVLKWQRENAATLFTKA